METTNVTARRSRRSKSPWSTAALRLPAREANLVPRPVSALSAVILSGAGRMFRTRPYEMTTRRRARRRRRGPTTAVGRANTSYWRTGVSARTRPMRSSSGVADPRENS
jgi:hypothetical protein